MTPLGTVIPASTPKGATVTGEKGKESAPVEAKKVAFSVPYLEMRSTVKTPEMIAKKVEISDHNFENLVNTLVAQFDILENTPVANRPANTTLRGLFYEQFKQKYGDVDLKKPEELRKYAEKFLREGGGVEVRMAVKLAEWEQATLQAYSGMMLEKKQGASKPDSNVQASFVLGPDGILRPIDTSGIRQSLADILKNLGKKKESLYQIKGGDNGQTAALLTAEQVTFLTQAGWGAGPLSLEKKTALVNRLYSVASVRAELYQQTGMPISDIELNFIKKDGAPPGWSYLNTKTAHFIGETGAGDNVRDILQNEGFGIATDVKTKVQEEIKKKKDEAREKKTDAKTADRLKDEINRIEASHVMTDVKKEEERKRIEAEKAKLEKDFRLFGRQRLLPGEITEAQKARDEAEQKLLDLQARIRANPPTGEAAADVNLKKWTDSTDPESWQAVKARCDGLEAQKDLIMQEINDLKTELKDHQASRPPLLVTKPGFVIPPEEIAARKQWTDREKHLQDEIDKRRNKINVDPWGGGDPLSKQIAELKAKYMRRKAVVEDDATAKQTIKDYRDAEDALKKRTDEKTKVDAAIVALTRTEVQLDGDIKTKDEELKNIGALTGAEKVESDALNALIPVFDSSSPVKTERDNRIKDAEMAAKGLTVYDLEKGPDWSNYPDAVLRCAQLIWGDDILLPTGDPAQKAKIEQVKTLLASKKYLDIFIDEIETAQAIPVANRATKGAAAADGKYTDINTAIQPAAAIRTVTIDKVNRDLVINIINKMRMAALNITAVTI